MSQTVVWIIVAVVVVLVVVGLLVALARRRSAKRVEEARQLRKDVNERQTQLEAQQATAREHQHRADAAEAEAQAKAAEADRLRARSDQHRSTLEDQQRDVDKMAKRADELDPKHRGDDAGETRRARDAEGSHRMVDDTGHDGRETGGEDAGRHARSEH